VFSTNRGLDLRVLNVNLKKGGAVMKTIGALLVALVLLFTGCDNRSDQLEKEKAQLQEAIKSRDEFIQTVLESINEVHTKLETARAHENTIVRQTGALEEGKVFVSAENRVNIMHQIEDIDATLSENRKKLADLETKLKSSKIQYASLNKMVDNLRESLDEREQSITLLSERVKSLENDVAEKTKLVAEKEAVIDQKDSMIRDQKDMLNTAYYVVGNKDDLENKGIIKDEGGFLWGLVGSTTVLANGFDNGYFRTIDKSREMTIEVSGKIDKIVPKRDESYYVEEQKNDSLSTLKIVQPARFWQENLLVVVTK
jgi:DNA repair exonuclease SbcCD ATPase subunit